MKKLFTSLLLLVGGMLFSTVSAENYNVSVGGITVTSSNKNNVTGTTISTGSSGYVKFDGDKTLTIKDATISPDGSWGIYSTISGLKIVIEGTVTIKAKNCHGMGLAGNTTISGKNFNASFWVWGGEESNGWTGIWVLSGSTLTFENLWAYIRGGYQGIVGRDNSNNRGELNVYTSFLDVTLMKTETSSCVTGFKEINTKGVTFDYNGYKYDTSNYKLVNSSGSVVKSHTFRPRLNIGRYIFNPRNNVTLNSSSTGSGITSGTVSWNATAKQLTLNKAVLKPQGSFTAISYFGLTDAGDVDIWLDDASSITTSSGGRCILANNRDLVIGGQSVSVGDKLTLTAEGATAIEITGGKKLTLDGAEFVISGKTYGINGFGSGSLVISKCKLSSTSTDYNAISGFASCEMTNSDVNTVQSPVIFNATKKGFADISGTLAKKVVIGIPTKIYRTDVCGKTINNLCASNVIVPGLTAGKIAYSPGSSDYSGTLALTDVTLASTNANQAVIRPGYNPSDNITINCSGTNNLSGGHSTIYPGGNLTISGSGKLLCDATNCTFGGLYTQGGNVTITLDMNGEVKFEKGKYGFVSNKCENEKLVLKKKSGSSDYYFCGTSSAINNLKTLSLTDMDFYSGDTGFPGCYFDEDAHCVKVNGGTTSKNANFYQVYATYDVKVAGVILNNCNQQGLGSKYITAGGTKAVTYNGSSKKLMLNNVTINTGESSWEGIRNAYSNSIDGLVIDLTGVNKLADGKSYSLYLGTNTTIQGSGSLEVGSFMGFDGTIAIKNVNMKFLKNMNASNGGKLTVDLTTAGKKVEVAGTVSGWDLVSTLNGTKVWGKNGACYFNTSKKAIVYTSDDSNASKIVFADKNADAIDAAEIDNNAEVRDIYDANGRQMQGARKGLNIIRMKDGTVRKVMVK